MSLILSSIFRDSTDYADRWVEQVSALHEQRPLRVVVAEGDSTDGTYAVLERSLAQAPFEATLLKVDHGGPKYGSVNVPERWHQIATVCNRVMIEVARTIADDDEFVYVESDLVWPIETPLALLDGLKEYPAVAAMSMHSSGRFYDIWGHVKDGIGFSWDPPFHPRLNGDRYVEIDSAGSIFAMRGRLARLCRFSETDCIRGIGRDLRRHDASLWLDTAVEVVHQ